LLGNWVFGCDDCQTVCPWNDAIAENDPDFFAPYLPRLLRMSDAEFSEIYADTAVARVRRRGLARNAALALGNTRNPDALAPLAKALREDPDTTVRGAAAWAVGRLGGKDAMRTLQAVDCGREASPVAAEVRAALARLRRGVDTLSSPTADGVI
jgi:epoxyqueuosine reductase